MRPTADQSDIGLLARHYLIRLKAVDLHNTLVTTGEQSFGNGLAS